VGGFEDQEAIIGTQIVCWRASYESTEPWDLARGDNPVGASAGVPQQLFRATAGNVAVLADDDDWARLQQEHDEQMAADALQQSQQAEQAAEQQNEAAQQQAMQSELQGQWVSGQAGQ
jgi:hypothetical protein